MQCVCRAVSLSFNVSAVQCLCHLMCLPPSVSVVQCVRRPVSLLPTVPIPLYDCAVSKLCRPVSLLSANSVPWTLFSPVCLSRVSVHSDHSPMSILSSSSAVRYRCLSMSLSFSFLALCHLFAIHGLCLPVFLRPAKLRPLDLTVQYLCHPRCLSFSILAVCPITCLRPLGAVSAVQCLCALPNRVSWTPQSRLFVV